ncbi:hypothetical protein BST20_17390 [Mycobacterium branderi]|uniref:Uncharacterized protein n=1 Tax=Mycobacterium branderi TaxID=43348 RepID=A0AA91RH35_9MYCO|nr:hypothetical protein BST20_17390 [Mycobacterium branderi]
MLGFWCAGNALPAACRTESRPVGRQPMPAKRSLRNRTHHRAHVVVVHGAAVPAIVVGGPEHRGRSIRLIHGMVRCATAG